MLSHLSIVFFGAPLLSFLSIFFSALVLGIVYLIIRFSVLFIFILLKPILKDSYFEAADKYFERVEQKTKIFINTTITKKLTTTNSDNNEGIMLITLAMIAYLYTCFSPKSILFLKVVITFKTVNSLKPIELSLRLFKYICVPSFTFLEL